LRNFGQGKSNASYPDELTQLLTDACTVIEESVEVGYIHPDIESSLTMAAEWAQSVSPYSSRILDSLLGLTS
jgi:hypothetical protein